MPALSALGGALSISVCPAFASESSQLKPILQQTKSIEKADSTSQIFHVVDVEGVEVDNAEAGCKTFELKRKPRAVSCPLLIIGGGTGGVAAALAAVRSGVSKVCLIEETSWLGGQFTSQAVSAPDENSLVESTGATRTYKLLREYIREHYRNLGATDGGARFEPWLDPGNCWVSRVAFEPSVALTKIGDMLTPAVSTEKLQIYMRYKAVAIKTERQKITSVLCVNLDTGKFLEFRCKFCLDATELGDAVALASVPYVSGAESKAQTGEDHAPEIANPENVQDFTYPFIVEFCTGENHTIAKPPLYDEFKASGKFTLSGYRMFENASHSSGSGIVRELLPFWEYRRIIAKENFEPSVFPNDIAMINWESNDLRGRNIIDQAPRVMAEHLVAGKALSLGFLHWLQTEAPRDDGGAGYPELKLRCDLSGSQDGLSKYPYIRESRRILSSYTIVENDITRKANPGARAKRFGDTVGIGHYPVDIHGHQDVPGVGQATTPFQIPAGALVQNHVRNLIPACKNIGTTHVTNGAYRLHPIEWAIGEAAGTMASKCLLYKRDPWRLLLNKKILRSLQNDLLKEGAPLIWFDDVKPEDESFAAIQFAALTGVLPLSPTSLSFKPAEIITQAEAALALRRLLRLPDGNIGETDEIARAVKQCVAAGLFAADIERNGNVAEPLSPLHLVSWNQHPMINIKAAVPGTAAITKAQFADWLYQILQTSRFFGRL